MELLEARLDLMVQAQSSDQGSVLLDDLKLLRCPRQQRQGAGLNLVDPVIRHPDERMTRGHALKRHLRELAGLAREHQALTIAFLEAAMEARLRDGQWPASDDDSCRIVPLATPLAQLITAGQQRGELKPFPSAEDTAAFITNAGLLRGFTPSRGERRGDEGPGACFPHVRPRAA